VANPRDESVDRLRAAETTEDVDIEDIEDTDIESTDSEDTDSGVVDDAAIGGDMPHRRGRGRGTSADDAEEDGGHRSRLSVPLVPVLAVLFVLLLAGTAFLWFTRPQPSSVRTADYVSVLEAARSGVVDLTSFDYLTIDDDIAQIKKIAIGDLQKESVGQLNSKRQELTDQQAVVNTRVVGAAVTRADDTNGTVLLVIESTQKTKASTQPTVVRYRIQVELQKVSGRWLLSGVSGR
jgi:Mce-associated membrane protein